jgi:hypothetical protein
MRNAMPMPESRSTARVVGLLCIIGALLVFVGSFLTWFLISASFTGPITFNMDLYQIPAAGGARLAIGIAAVGLAIIGLGAIVLSSHRRLPAYWGCAAIAVAAATIAFGTGAVFPPRLIGIDGPFPVSRFPWSRGNGHTHRRWSRSRVGSTCARTMGAGGH